MARNNHQYTKNVRELLDIKLFSQPFLDFSQPSLQLDDGKLIAQLYMKLENAISVLSYIYAGGIAERLGLRMAGTEINSIWEDDLLGRVHPEDLQKKYRLEFQFFKLIKSISVSERRYYSVITKLRIRNSEGKYVLIKHRLLYLNSTQEGDIWLALCLYNLEYDYPGFDVPEGLIINNYTGAIINNKCASFDKILSTREGEILQLIKLGMRSKEIASKLTISIYTVNRHRQNIFQKLNVKNAMEASRVADAAGLLKLDL
jgi:DNA-binding CsgD family transcriptional regulator